MATPTEWLNEFQVNTGAADSGFPIDSQIIGLSNGNILVAWTESGTGVTAGPDTDIIGKIYDAEGNLVRDAYSINSSRFVDDESDFDIQPTNDGGFILVYVDNDFANSGSSIIWERKDASGDNINDVEIASEFSPDDSLSNPQVAVNLLDNTSVVTYTDDFSDGTNIDLDVEAQAVSATGVLGNQFNAGTNSSLNERSGEIDILTNGNYVSVYERDDASGLTGVEFQIFTPTGGFIASSEVAPGGDADRDPVVASLTNGNFVVAWQEDGPSGTFDNDIKAQVYTSTGALVGSTILAANSFADENEPSIAALPDGDFVIAWDNDTDASMEARRFNADGTSDGFAFVVDNNDAFSPDVGVTGDGRILFTWERLFANDIFASIWDPRTSPIEASDYQLNLPNFVNSTDVTSLTSSSTVNGDFLFLDNTIRGQAGDDTLDGGSGLDTINGGGGDDTISGGFSIDNINGGAGNDTIIVRDGEFIDNVDGGGGNDVLDLSDISSPSEAVTIDFNTNLFNGFGGPTTIARIEEVIGTQSGDFITADGQRDTIRGQDGDDVLVGGGGPDRLFGDRGNDTLVGEGGGDILNGGGGNDEIFGQGALDLLSGGGGDDTLVGGAGSDTLIGDAGKDRLTGSSGADFFEFNSIAETQVGTQRDVITDFELDIDLIDLSGIDANNLFLGDQAFSFIGTSAYSGSAGELRFSNSGNNTLVRGDVNGDTLDDFQIQLVGTFQLLSIDFIL